MNEFSSMLIAAVAPAIILLYYIRKKDKYVPEPWREILKAFLLGTLSIPLSLCFSVPLEWLGFCPADVLNISDAVQVSFFGAAIPEELAKMIILLIFLKTSRYFDEYMDGIVYAVAVSMGFAAVENIVYLLSSFDGWREVGISRAIFAVPGHFADGVAMGYFFALSRFGEKSKRIFMFLLAFAVPVLLHGIYDSLLFATGVVGEGTSLLLSTAFIVFFIYLQKYATRNVRKHLDRDLKRFQNMVDSMEIPDENENNPTA